MVSVCAGECVLVLVCRCWCGGDRWGGEGGGGHSSAAVGAGAGWDDPPRDHLLSFPRPPLVSRFIFISHSDSHCLPPPSYSDHRVNMYTYKRCCSGRGFVDWVLMQSSTPRTRQQVAQLWQALLLEGVLQHGIYTMSYCGWGFSMVYAPVLLWVGLVGE